MSAFAKLYAQRSSETRNATTSVGSTPLYAPKMPDPETSQRRIGFPKPLAMAQSSSNENDLSKPDVQRRDLNVALSMIENVNSGFIDICKRLEQSETLREQIITENEEQNQYILSLQFEFEKMERRAADAEGECAELADRVVAETARASFLEKKMEQVEVEMNSAGQRITELEENCKNFHDKIISAFGVGSPTHKALSSLTDRWR